MLATTFAMWAMQWIVELGFELNKPVIIYSDNKSCIAIARNANINFKYSKHIDVRQMFIREIIAKGDISVLYVKTNLNISDGLTKPLGKANFRKFRDELTGNVNVVGEITTDEIETSLAQVFEQ